MFQFVKCEAIFNRKKKRLEYYDKHFIIFLAQMQKTVEIVAGKTRERPPLNICGQYYKIYFPKDIIIDSSINLLT